MNSWGGWSFAGLPEALPVRRVMAQGGGLVPVLMVPVPLSGAQAAMLAGAAEASPGWVRVPKWPAGVTARGTARRLIAWGLLAADRRWGWTMYRITPAGRAALAAGAVRAAIPRGAA